MKKIMIQKITQNNWNFWTVNLIMRAKKIVNQLSDFPVRRTGSYGHKKALFFSVLQILVVGSVRYIKPTHVGFRANVKIASRIVSYR